jgi:hypothetical protein
MKMAVTKTYSNTMLTNMFSGAYIGLSTTQPNVDGTGVTEPPSGTGYSRVAASGGGFSASNGTVTNSNYLYFPEATVSWGTVIYLCVFEGNSSSSKVRYFGALTTPKTIDVNSVPLFRPGSINISIVEG